MSKHPRPAAPTSTDHPFRAAVFKNLWPLAQARGWDAFEAFYLAVGVAILALGIDPALFGLRARCRRGHGLARLYDYQNRHGTAFVQCRPCMRINRRARRHRKRASSSAEHHTASQWELMLKLSGYFCGRCGVRMTEPGAIPRPTDWTLDHIVPLLKAGSDAIWNAQLLCRGCNLQKHVED